MNVLGPAVSWPYHFSASSFVDSGAKRSGHRTESPVKIEASGADEACWLSRKTFVSL